MVSDLEPLSAVAHPVVLNILVKVGAKIAKRENTIHFLSLCLPLNSTTRLSFWQKKLFLRINSGLPKSTPWLTRTFTFSLVSPTSCVAWYGSNISQTIRTIAVFSGISNGGLMTLRPPEPLYASASVKSTRAAARDISPFAPL